MQIITHQFYSICSAYSNNSLAIIFALYIFADIESPILGRSFHYLLESSTFTSCLILILNDEQSL